MVKHTQTIRRLLPTTCLSMFDHFVGLALKGLILLTLILRRRPKKKKIIVQHIQNLDFICKIYLPEENGVVNFAS